MRIACSFAVLAFALTMATAEAATPKPGVGKVLATKLMTKKAFRPQTHGTDFGTDALGCITLARWELRAFGYPGHAFLCEEGATSEVLGAVLSRAGVVRCYISGVYIGDGCYDFDICGVPETACVE
jgi:hypothetical protein